jgi:hydrogenase maturation protein HypF
MAELSGLRVKITGIVQGVGFRPFVYGLATRMNLKGWVRNTSAGVDIEVVGTVDQLENFVQALKNDHPPLARLDSLLVDSCPPNGYSNFEIVHSESIPGAFIPISPDVSICEDCLRELFDPSDKRYLYPFINCTNCGPRFTIIEDIPYDRPKTTMAPFEMCGYCRAEYENPLNRRFHAQPVACPECGPQVWLEKTEDRRPKTDSQSFIPRHPSRASHVAMLETRNLIANGKILAIKGLGGFHLACDATNADAVAELRQRKLRVDKPFALMMPDIQTVEQHCYLSDAERELLLSRERPIVLLDRKPGSKIALAVAPHQKTLAVMLPYTPLHYLLFSDGRPMTDDRITPSPVSRPPSILVMTSGNLSEEPIAYTNDEARERLSMLADALLMHNREIRTRCDDSVVRVVSWPLMVDGKTKHQLSATNYQLRRSRGYAPNPIKLPWEDVPQILATGPELKNTFCLTKGNYAFLSHHIGDMENYETLRSFEDGIEHFERLFRVNPDAIAYDSHPNYLATRYALERAQRFNLPAFSIQHHHAHIAACMADNGLNSEKPVIGVAFDGTGYGDDGAIWGGEFLIADYLSYQRFAHLEYSPLPGGDSAIKKPYRIALAQLWQNSIEWDDSLPPVVAACGDDMTLLRSMLENKINSPVTSSMGRLFDAVAALVGVRSEVNYEAQAAIEFEALADPDEKVAYPFDFDGTTLKVSPMLHSLIDDYHAGVQISTISAKFHNGLADAVLEICHAARKQFGLSEVALSGGVWQNMTLLSKTIPLLERANFTVYIHEQVPTNDGGLSLGQGAIGIHRFQR